MPAGMDDDDIARLHLGLRGFQIGGGDRLPLALG
jgi:hypothetical protein